MTVNDHFYTTSASEQDNAIANLGYTSEGIACYTFDTQQSNTLPLYRLLKDTHFYTTSASERDTAVAAGYQSEGTACYVYAGPTGTVPFYRLVKEGHFYTTSLPERDNAISALGYTSEDIACHVFGSQSSGTVPLYRLLKGSDHFYTTSASERDMPLPTSATSRRAPPATPLIRNRTVPSRSIGCLVKRENESAIARAPGS